MIVYGLVYALLDPFGKIRYIGQTCDTIEQRFKEHLFPSNLKNLDHKTNWIKSLLSKNQKPTIRLLQDNIPVKFIETKEKQWDMTIIDTTETEWIRLYKLIGAKLTNSTNGGGGQHGRIPSKETLRKMSESHKGKNNGPVAAANISKALTGKKRAPFTKEHKRNIAIGATGKLQSEESKYKKSVTLKANQKNTEHLRKLSEARRGVPQSPELIAKRVASCKLTLERNKKKKIDAINAIFSFLMS